MDLHEKLMKTHEELTKLRTQRRGVNQGENPKILLDKLHSLGDSISQALKDSERISKKICNEINHYELERNDNLCVGKNSVKPLVECKRIATEVFADIKTNNGREFVEKSKYDSLEQELGELEKSQAKSQEFMKYVELSLEGLRAIFDINGKERSPKSFDSEVTSASNNTDHSTLGFSVFENSATNAATSSPLGSPSDSV